jgi:hypothetical protein
MGRKARHHYIPKCYLKGFTNGGESSSPFWAVPVNKDAPYLTSPNDSCVQRDYYTVNHEDPLIVENFYAEQIEPKILKAINFIKIHSRLPPKEDMNYLTLLLATLYLRVPSYRESLEMPLRRMKEIVESINQEINISNKNEFEYSTTDVIKKELKLIDTVQKCLLSKYYQLYFIEDENVDLITSDKPFVISHPKGGSGVHFGLNTAKIEICVPITSKVILIARNEKVKEGGFIASKEMIGLANMKIAFSANRLFFSKTKEILFTDNNKQVYMHNIKTDK